MRWPFPRRRPARTVRQVREIELRLAGHLVSWTQFAIDPVSQPSPGRPAWDFKIDGRPASLAEVLRLGAADPAAKSDHSPLPWYER